MSSEPSSSAIEFRDGVRHSLPFLLSVVPYGMIVGTLAINNGATPFAAMMQSTLFFAGASQTVMWELYGLGNPAPPCPASLSGRNSVCCWRSPRAGQGLNATGTYTKYIASQHNAPNESNAQ